ncbi:VWA domain-containing protein [Pseudomonas sp. 5P_3.1_Bac2]|uniref:VWA domain-containing protein n=1 Tax=Pseudomonas sp. 5P_3.1_Bac2 TaxID=2971617 RepID=UPI0021C683DB|nr:VWA domain-containing protein [Pseudomonas sp. 5P_3.1_Bac2]MCU1716054.1 VWA domain-containing protein [Pseudomonas sp. 5P_3.1_Bac2]
MSQLLELWPHWQRPWWLLLAPVLGLLLWQLWHRKKRSGNWQALLPKAFHATLLSAGQSTHSRLPLYLLALTWLLALVALLGPSWQRVEQHNPKPSDPLVVVIQLTPSMLASDALPNRLEQAKRKLLDLLEERQDAQTAVLVYAGSAHVLVPLSDDLATSRNLLDALSPGIMPQAGQRADLAVTKALHLLEQGAQGSGRVLLLTSALDPLEQQGVAQALDGQGERLLILGIGTAQGAPIRLEDGSFMKDEQGAILLPRLDSKGLRSFAAGLGGQYQSARLDDSDLRALGLFDKPMHIQRLGELTRLQDWADQSHWLLLPLLLIAACAGRRGWLLCLPLLLIGLPQNSYAYEFNDLWLRPDQQGQRLLEAQQPAQAAQHFDDPRWQAYALYQAGDYAAAAKLFSQGDSAADHYNRGNALARSNELEAAIEAYDQALQLQPDLSAAQKNKELVEQELRKNQQQPQQGEAQPEQSGDQQQNQPNQAAGQGQEQNQTPQPGNSNQPNEQKEQKEPSQTADEPKPNGQQSTDTGQAKQSQPPADASAEPTETDTSASAPAALDEPLTGERRQALEQWLRQIPDDPGELLKRKFRLEQQRQEQQQ